MSGFQLMRHCGVFMFFGFSPFPLLPGKVRSPPTYASLPISLKSPGQVSMYLHFNVNDILWWLAGYFRRVLCDAVASGVFPLSERSLAPGCELPVLRRCEAEVPVHLSVRQTWLESLRSWEDDALGLVELHPDVFSVPPRYGVCTRTVGKWMV